MEEKNFQWKDLVETSRMRLTDWVTEPTRAQPVSARYRGAEEARSSPDRREGSASFLTSQLILARLSEEVPREALTVVIDGRLVAWALAFADAVTRERDYSSFWLVGSEEGGEVLQATNFIHLDAACADDVLFCQYFVADLVLVPREPARSQRERALRWLTRCAYLLIQSPADIDSSELSAGKVSARVFEAHDETLNCLT
jgi:hypothetical protein